MSRDACVRSRHRRTKLRRLRLPAGVREDGTVRHRPDLAMRRHQGQLGRLDPAPKLSTRSRTISSCANGLEYEAAPITPPPARLRRWRSRRDIWYRFRRSEEHTSELQSLMRISYAVFCLKKKTK